MKKNAKRWIALAITIVVVLLAAFTGDRVNQNTDKLKDKYLDSFMAYPGYRESVLRGSNSKEKIKIVNVNGIILSDGANDFAVNELKEAAEDPSIAGVILNVDSPGGSVYASERIANEVEGLKEANKPVYAVMGEMAASGGYYISAPTDKIYASNETWTGSIGVIIQSYSLEGLFDKHGIKEQNITTGAMKDAGSYGSDMTDEEKEYFQGLVDSAFDRFVSLVAKGRNMSEREVRKLADGRVYDGSQALENGLIDEIGDIDKAIADMTLKNNLSDPMIIMNENIMGPFANIFSMVKDLRKESRSDLAILNDFMDGNDLRPMYLFGGHND
ncbi:MAG: signal peptide peptidase SppA [Anaerococcus sp.]|nr:signal peptide peptidase SppA [Anaerococcus sp.]